MGDGGHAPSRPKAPPTVQGAVFNEKLLEVYQSPLLPSSTPHTLSHHFLTYNMVGVARSHSNDDTSMIEVLVYYIHVQSARLESRVSWVPVPPEAAHFSLEKRVVSGFVVLCCIAFESHLRQLVFLWSCLRCCCVVLYLCCFVVSLFIMQYFNMTIIAHLRITILVFCSKPSESVSVMSARKDKIAVEKCNEFHKNHLLKLV